MTRPIPKPTRTIHDLTADERATIRERRKGLKGLSSALLALVFSVPVQAINAVLRGEG